MIIYDEGNPQEVERQIREYMLAKARFAKKLSVNKVDRSDLETTPLSAQSKGLGFTTGEALKFKKKADKDLF